jgi:membrane associated rhomboid family serine protease
MNILNESKYRFLYATPVIRLIVVNVAFFLVTKMVDVFYFMMTRVSDLTLPYIALPGHYHTVLLKPWTVVTYQFSHSGLFHIVFNMLMLYVVGSIFLDFFRKKDVWKVYILGGVIAGLFFVLSNAFIPAFRGYNSILVGASGGVMAILFATASYAPNIRLNLFGVFPVKLIWIALGYLVIDLLSIPGSNGGGHIAHLGGAVFGWLFANFRKGRLQFSLFETVAGSSPRNRQMKVEVNQSRPYGKVQKNSQMNAAGTPTQEEVDAILDKISKSGYDRLSKEEKDILFKASQD